MTDEQYKEQRRQAAVIQLRRFFQLLLDDMALMQRNTWKELGRPEGHVQLLEQGLQLKIQTYNQLLDVHLGALSDMDPLEILRLATMPPALAADLQKHSALQLQQESPALSFEEEPGEPCAFCDGEGGSLFEHGGEEHRIPCQACGGTGKAADI